MYANYLFRCPCCHIQVSTILTFTYVKKLKVKRCVVLLKVKYNSRPGLITIFGSLLRTYNWEEKVAGKLGDMLHSNNDALLISLDIKAHQKPLARGCLFQTAVCYRTIQ